MKEKRFFLEAEILVGLLNLDSEIFPMDNGYWPKFEVWRVDLEPHVPHGVRYSLTMARYGIVRMEKVRRNIRPVVEATHFTVQFGLYASSLPEQGTDTARI